MTILPSSFSYSAEFIGLLYTSTSAQIFQYQDGNLSKVSAEDAKRLLGKKMGVYFDGKVMGQIEIKSVSTELPSAFDVRTSSPAEKIQVARQSLHLNFSGPPANSGNRPLLIVEGLSASDPDRWRRLNLKKSLSAKITGIKKSAIPNAELACLPEFVKARKKKTVTIGESDFHFDRSFSNAKNSLFALNLQPSKAKEKELADCGDEMGIAQRFLISNGSESLNLLVNRVGHSSNMELLDAVELNRSGRSTLFIFEDGEFPALTAVEFGKEIRVSRISTYDESKVEPK